MSHLRRGNVSWKNTSVRQTGLQAILWDIFTIDDSCARAQPTAGGAISEQAEQDLGIKPVHGTPLWPPLQFLP